MQNIKRFVEHVKMDHEERLQDIRIQMKSLPPGDLIFARKNQKYYCVQKLNDQRFGITTDQQLVQGLALKRYLQEERDALQDNLKILDKVLKDCQNTSFDDIMQSLPPGFRQLPREYYRLKKKKKTYCKSPYYPEHLIYRTHRGELVRSNSEQSIGNARRITGSSILMMRESSSCSVAITRISSSPVATAPRSSGSISDSSIQTKVIGSTLFGG